MKEKPTQGRPGPRTWMEKITSGFSTYLHCGTEAGCHVKGGFTETAAESLKENVRASLVAQWLRICPPMRGTRVRALVWEDPTCRGATGPVSHNH